MQEPKKQIALKKVTRGRSVTNSFNNIFIQNSNDSLTSNNAPMTPPRSSSSASSPASNSGSSPIPSTSTSLAPHPLTRVTLMTGRRLNRRMERLVSNNDQPQPSTSTGFGIGRGKGGIRRFERDIRRLNAQRHANSLRALREVEYLTSRRGDIPRATFIRVVKEICGSRGLRLDFKWQVAALEALKEACEAYAVNMFERCTLLINHANRVTLMTRDIALALRLDKRKQ